MKIAVTGATGFVGTRLVERLIDEGHDVRVFTRSVEKARRVFAEPKYKQSVEYVAYTPTESGDWQAEMSVAIASSTWQANPSPNAGRLNANSASLTAAN